MRREVDRKESLSFGTLVMGAMKTYLKLWIYTSKCMHGMNQTEAEHPRHGKRSQTASLIQIGPVVLEIQAYSYSACAE